MTVAGYQLPAAAETVRS